MNNTKFTPGPWRAYELHTYFSIRAKIENDSVEIASSGCDEINEIDRANANLIAAAPDMYEALDGTIGYLLELKVLMRNSDKVFSKSIQSRIDKIKAALNKANPQ